MYDKDRPPGDELLLHRRVGPEVVGVPRLAMTVVRVHEQDHPEVPGRRLGDALVEHLEVGRVDVPGRGGVAAVDARLVVAPPTQWDTYRVGPLRHVVGGVLRLDRAPLTPVVAAQGDRVPGRVEDLRARYRQPARLRSRRADHPRRGRSEGR